MNYMMRLLFYNVRTPVKKYLFESKTSSFFGELKNANRLLPLILTEGRRHLLTASSLGLDRFLEVRKVMNDAIKDKDNFLKEMEEASQSDSILIFANDIKKVVMIVSECNVHIIPKLLKKLSLQNQTIKFQKYVFGPDIMKLYHLYNKPKEALALIEDEDTVKHFIQITSFCVLADLLFINGMYEDVVYVYQYFHSKVVTYSNPVQPMIVLYFGACYKLNSKASLEEAIALWEKLNRKHFKINKRALGFFGLLALNQNKPQIAIETLFGVPPDPVILSIQAMGLAMSKRFDEVLKLLKEASEDETLYITSDATSFIRNQLTKEKLEYIPKFQKIHTQKANKFFSRESLEDILFQEVELFISKKRREIHNTL